MHLIYAADRDESSPNGNGSSVQWGSVFDEATMPACGRTGSIRKPRPSSRSIAAVVVGPYIRASQEAPFAFDTVLLRPSPSSPHQRQDEDHRASRGSRRRLDGRCPEHHRQLLQGRPPARVARFRRGPRPRPSRPLADDIVAAIPDSAIESIVYPATFDDYGLSVADGAEALTAALDRYSDACPNGKVVLLGYSQGAHVTLDALCGREESTGAFAFNETTPIPESIVDKSVIAVILYGDPTHMANATWNKGNSTRDGVRPTSVPFDSSDAQITNR
ncbi:Axe2 [Verticillium alfalfae VaMs.102]|uniref:Axe2 n=1 Tax=Verticillium alfalfae (strain VaMs.102 / ATCC MYA-4576 / FGSC 10136) TaxID=526221 RepID=C9SN49_VERA1|nr:Axe2 [Verticillium alfalfae VaMs.102]EEY20214.1 Axe2 [Verticillium alfalfae VaMs.102]